MSLYHHITDAIIVCIYILYVTMSIIQLSSVHFLSSACALKRPSLRSDPGAAVQPHGTAAMAPSMAQHGTVLGVETKHPVEDVDRIRLALSIMKIYGSVTSQIHAIAIASHLQ